MLTNPNTGATNQTLQDVAVMRAVPGMSMVEPADAAELHQTLPALVAQPGLVYLWLVWGDVGGACPRVSSEGYRFAFGKVTLLRAGCDITLIGAGLMTSGSLQAARMLEEEGISATVLNVAAIKPLDAETITAWAERTGAVVTAENHTVLGGLGGSVAELLGRAIRCP